MKNRFDETKVRNFYYLLAYAFDDEKINFQNDEKFGSEKMKNIYDLFAIVLFIRLKELLQEGMYNEYVEYNEDLPYIKGRLDILKTFRTQTLQIKNRVFCDYEEYSVNNMINQIIKTTIRCLLKNDLLQENKIRLRQLYHTFENIDYIKDPNQILWDNLKFNKLNKKYEVIIKICKYVLKELIHNKEDENETFSHIDDDQKYHALFEKFIRNYLIRYFFNYRDEPINSLNIVTKKMKWMIDEKSKDKTDDRYIPKMHTDITISNTFKPGKVKIIDAKFYSNILRDKGFNGQEAVNINSGNWYQLFSYIMNEKWHLEEKLRDKQIETEVSGILLYASTGEDFQDFEVSVHGNRMGVNVIDFTQEFGNPETAKIDDRTIAGQMKKLAESIYEEIK